MIEQQITGGDWGANPFVWAIDFKVLSTTGRPAQAKQGEQP